MRCYFIYASDRKGEQITWYYYGRLYSKAQRTPTKERPPPKDRSVPTSRVSSPTRENVNDVLDGETGDEQAKRLKREAAASKRALKKQQTEQEQTAKSMHAHAHRFDVDSPPAPLPLTFAAAASLPQRAPASPQAASKTEAVKTSSSSEEEYLSSPRMCLNDDGIFGAAASSSGDDEGGGERKEDALSLTSSHPSSSDLEDEPEMRNASGTMAEQQNLADSATVVVQLDTCTAGDLWTLFNNKKCSGGYIARSVFISGKLLEEPKQPSPWSGQTALAKTKKAASDQMSLFFVWAAMRGVMDWIRVHIFVAVREKPRTYKGLSVHHAGCGKNTDGLLVSLESIQATNDTMARIGHLCCDSEGRLILNLLFGKKPKEALDDQDLQPDALWEQLAALFVNNPEWDVATASVMQVTTIDVTKAPEKPGKPTLPLSQL